MKMRVVKLDPIVLKEAYPIADRLDGWFFRIDELTAGSFVVEGIDTWGRKVSRGGDEPSVLLDKCVLDAKQIVDSSNEA
jgi:hypothetical protein